MSVAAIILAAGASRRMGGQPKALLAIDGTTFVAAIAETARAAGVSSRLVVLGPPHGVEVRARLPVGLSVVWNPDPSRGMLSSVQAAIAQLPPSAQAALVWPVDSPRVSVESVRRVLAAPAGRIAVPRHLGRGGHPLRLPRVLFGAVLSLPTEASLRTLLEQESARVAHVEVDDPAVARDVDTPEDYRRERGEPPAPATDEPAARAPARRRSR